KLPIPIGPLRKAADVVNSRAAQGLDVVEDFSVKIAGYEYPSHGDPQEIKINTMHAALSGDDKVRKNLGFTIEKAAEILWNEMLDWQSMYFGLKPTQKLLALINEAQSQLARQVVGSSQSAENDLELYTLLEALKCPDKGVSFRVALPNL